MREILFTILLLFCLSACNQEKVKDEKISSSPKTSQSLAEKKTVFEKTELQLNSFEV